MIRQERSSGIAAARAEARRIGRVITPDLTAALGMHVRAAFADAQERVGVHSRALRNSGRSGTDVRDDGTTWIGFAAWEDDTPPTDYALYHLSVNDEWLSMTPVHEAAMEETINAHIRGHVG